MINEDSKVQIKLSDASSKEQSLKDFENIQKIVEGELGLSELDEFSKRRMITICQKRLEVIKAKVEEKKREADKLEDLLYKVKKL